MIGATSLLKVAPGEFSTMGLKSAEILVGPVPSRGGPLPAIGRAPLSASFAPSPWTSAQNKSAATLLALILAKDLRCVRASQVWTRLKPVANDVLPVLPRTCHYPQLFRAEIRRTALWLLSKPRQWWPFYRVFC